MTNSTKGFSLIELMIAIAIIGILASIAIPAYQNYAVRAKISEAINLASAAKVSVAEHYMGEGHLPENSDEAGITTVNTRYVDALSYQLLDNTSYIIVTLSANVSEDLAQKKIVLSATVDDNDSLHWQCQAAENNGVDGRYLPSSCRRDDDQETSTE